MSTLNIRDFDIVDWQDESRVDQLCQETLQLFHRSLLDEQQCEPLEAGSLARGADYFLREFVIGDRQDNIFEIKPVRIHQFAGNWYIIKNMEPNMEELTDLLFGIDAFYSWVPTLAYIIARSKKRFAIYAGHSIITASES